MELELVSTFKGLHLPGSRIALTIPNRRVIESWLSKTNELNLQTRHTNLLEGLHVKWDACEQAVICWQCQNLPSIYLCKRDMAADHFIYSPKSARHWKMTYHINSSKENLLNRASH